MRDAALRQALDIRLAVRGAQGSPNRRPCEPRGPYAVSFSLGHDGSRLSQQPAQGVMGPCVRRDDEGLHDDGPSHTAVLRCRTGAPTVRLSAASMMALASRPWWR